MTQKIVMNEMFPHGYYADNQEVKLSHITRKVTDTPNTKVAAVIILNECNQILVSFNTKRQVWDIPQGGVDENEDVILAAIREVKEEISLTLSTYNLKLVSKFRNISSGMPDPFETSMYILSGCQYQQSINLKDLVNNEPDKNTNLSFRALSQLPQPQGLSLRLAVEMLK